MGRAMFLTHCSPTSSNGYGSLSLTWSRTTREMQMPPGFANVSSLAAILTPSPKMSSGSAITSPRLADAKPDAPLVAYLGFAVNHPALDLHGAAHRIHHARKFRQQSVAGIFHDPAPMLTDLGVDKLRQMCLDAFVRALLILAHQPRIPCHIRGKDCS